MTRSETALVTAGVTETEPELTDPQGRIMAEISGAQARLAARLRELRATTFRSGSALARHLRWHQTRVNKIENGQQLPSDEDLDAWVAATNTSPDVRAELGELLTYARLKWDTWTDTYQGGSAAAITAWQAGHTAPEASTSLSRGYQPSMLPGLVQTAAYAREMLTICGRIVLPDFGPDGIEALIARRIQRQELLYQPGSTVQYVIGEAALRVHFGRVETLLAQLDRLVTLMDLPALDLRVLPAVAPCPIMPLSGFRLDDASVAIETFTGEQTLTAPEDIAAYTRAFEALRAAALAGPDAGALIQRVAAELRGVPDGR
ncbi:MAG: helix-turn-helix domain-containing protein [Pseudonocardiaceae bacterium]